jgi:cysteine desulfurase / selenocysteine lyase
MEMIYLNNAATSFPKPAAVVDAVNRYNRSLPFHALRSGFETHQTDIVAGLREGLGKLFGIDRPEHIILTPGATFSLNLILRGILKHNDHVVTTRTEHNSVLRLLKTLERQEMITLSPVPCDACGTVDPEHIRSAVTANTRAVIVNHCSNVTGTVQDIARIGRIAADHDALFIVDAAQSAGCVNIHVKEACIDALAFAGHKSLFGMPGTGGLYLGPKVDPDPLVIGGTGVRSDYLFQPPGKPMYYEAGTPNMPGIASLNEGVSFVLNQGISAIQEKKNHLKQMVLEAFLNDNRIRVYGGNQTSDFTGNAAVISFNIRGIIPEDAAYILENAFGIICRSGLHCAPLIHESLGSWPKGSVRASFSCLNEEKDAQHLISAVNSIAKGD